MARRSAFAAVFLVCAAAFPAVRFVTAAAPASTAWFGVALPPVSGSPHRAVVDTRDIHPRPVQLPADDDRDSNLAGQAIQKHLERIVGFSSSTYGDHMWGRITGFPSQVAVTNWVASEFRAAGLNNVQVQQYEGTGEFWYSRTWEARLLPDARFGDGTGPVMLNSVIPTSGSQIASGTLTAPLIVAGDVSAPTASLEVTGRIAVQRVKPASGVYADRARVSNRAKSLIGKGAVAVVTVVEQTGNMHVRDFGNCGGPCFNVGTEDGEFVEGVLAKAARAHMADAVHMQLKLETENLKGLKGQNVIGLVPGASDENIIVNAHADGWFDGAGDNGDGLSVLVALARHFGRSQSRPARTLVFVASGGHHSPGLNGPSNLVRMNPELVKKTVLVVNLEHVAQLYIRPDPWRAEATEQPMDFGISNQAPFLIALGKRGMDRYGFQLNSMFGASVPGDLGGYEPLHVARVQAIHSGPMYHTSGDTIDTISVPGLERAARFYAYFITEAAKARREEIDP